MIDVGTPARKAFYTALFEKVELDGSIIPFVDEKLDARISEHDLYILVGAQNEVNKSNKTNWVKEVDIVLTVVNRTKSSSTKTKIETIVTKISAIVFPTRQTLGISVEAPFSIVWAREIDANYAFEKLEAGFQVLKQITYRLRITQ